MRERYKGGCVCVYERERKRDVTSPKFQGKNFVFISTIKHHLEMLIIQKYINIKTVIIVQSPNHHITET